MDSESIKARCRSVARADAALKCTPSAAAVALDYILELEAENHRLLDRIGKLEKLIADALSDNPYDECDSYGINARKLWALKQALGVGDD